MTISSTTVKNSYSGNGTLDTFNYTFKIFADSDLQVIIRDATATETVKTLTTHYTVTGAGSASGGTIVFTSGNIPTATETVVIRRAVPQTQAIDYIANDPFPAESHEEGLDRAMMAVQQLQEEVTRSIKLSRTNTMNSTEFAIGSTERAGKIFGFDDNGELVVSQELGTFKGNWSASTTYNARDIVKDTSTGNIFLCNTGHTSSGSQPLTTNTDAAKWDLLVDASSATEAKDDAEKLAINPEDSQFTLSDGTTTGYSALHHKEKALDAQTAAETAQAAAETAKAEAEAIYDNFDDSYLGPKASNPSVDNDGDALEDGALYFDTTNNVMKVYDLGTTTWFQLTPTLAAQTNINTVAGIESEITTVANDQADIGVVSGLSTDIQALADIEDGTTATNAISNVGNNIASVTTAANNLTDIRSFANTYLGPSATAPTVDPDGSALDVGDLYFDTTSNVMKVYSSSGWVTAASAVNGTSDRFTFTVSSSTTTISGTDDAGNTLAYDAGYLDVYLNGIRMVNGTDVTVTSGTSIVFASAIGAAGTDVVDVVAFGTFNLSNFSINDANDVNTAGVSDGNVLVYNSSTSKFEAGTASSAEVYGFYKDSDGVLYYRTTNKGVDDITAAQYEDFEDVLYSASGFSFSLNSSGNLIATI